jgi:SAM-dependent methyltransferase
MQYDPIKRSLGRFFNLTPAFRKLFYRLLDLLLLRSWHIRKEVRRLKKEGFQPVHIADAGSGFGQYVFYLSNTYTSAQITGLDIKQEQVDDCNSFFTRLGRQQRVQFEYADLTQLEASEVYDLILCVDVMEHIEEDQKVFNGFHQALKPGGVLLISTPSDQGGSDVHHEHEESFIEEHVRDGYGVQEIEDKLRQGGFSDIHVRYSYGQPGKISWRLSMKYPILLVNTSKLFLILLPVYYLLAYPISFLLNRRDVRKEHSTGTGLIVRCTK